MNFYPWPSAAKGFWLLSLQWRLYLGYGPSVVTPECWKSVRRGEIFYNPRFASSFQRVVRVLPEGEVRRPEPDSQVEEAGIREPLLLALHPDQRHKFRHQLHLQSAQTEARRGENRRVCSLRVPGLFRLAPIQVHWCRIRYPRAFFIHHTITENFIHLLSLNYTQWNTLLRLIFVLRT